MKHSASASPTGRVPSGTASNSAATPRGVRGAARPGRGGAQRGTVLVIGLIVLLVLVVLGASSMRSSALQELMAGHTKNANAAFQAAEGAMQAALTWLHRQRVQAPPVVQRGGTISWNGSDPDDQPVLAACVVEDTASSGFDPCSTVASLIQSWRSYSGTGTLVGQRIDSAGGAGLSTLASATQPRFIIEDRFVADPDIEKANAGVGDHFFTVYAVGFDPGTNSRVILKTSIKKHYERY